MKTWLDQGGKKYQAYFAIISRIDQQLVVWSFKTVSCFEILSMCAHESVILYDEGHSYPQAVLCEDVRQG